MALARVCDRCGKTATKYFYGISSKKYFFEKRNHEDYISYSDKSYRELCPECMDKFVNFMSSNKKE